MEFRSTIARSPSRERVKVSMAHDRIIVSRLLRGNKAQEAIISKGDLESSTRRKLIAVFLRG